MSPAIPAAKSEHKNAAAVLGFLHFNFPTMHNRKVETFMGDAGSTFVGLYVVWVTTGVSQGPGAIATPVVSFSCASTIFLVLANCRDEIP